MDLQGGSYLDDHHSSRHFRNNRTSRMNYCASLARRQQTRFNTSVDGSYLVSVFYGPQCAGEEKNPRSFGFNNLHAIFNHHADDPGWHLADNPAYTLMLDGHLYLGTATTLDVDHNLHALLNHISVTTIEKGLQNIAGGLFNLIIIDKQNSQMVVCGDHLGMLPLYYLSDENGFHISGNQLSFLGAASISEEATVEFIKYGALPFAPSLLENVARLLPGQLLSVDLQEDRVTYSAARVLEFKPPAERISDPREASRRLHQHLTNYFARMTPGRYDWLMADHSTDAIVAAMSRQLSPTLISHLAPGSSRLLDRLQQLYLLDVSPLPPQDSPGSEALANYLSGMRTPVSLNSMLDVRYFQHLTGRGVKWTIDPFLGKALLDLNSIEWPADPPNMEAPADERIRDIRYYQEALYRLPGAIPDSELPADWTPPFECWFLNAARGILEVNRTAGHLHMDFVESLAIYTAFRSRFSTHITTLLKITGMATPFSDYQLLQTCMQLSTSLRRDNRITRDYLSIFYPEIANGIFATPLRKRLTLRSLGHTIRRRAHRRPPTAPRDDFSEALREAALRDSQHLVPAKIHAALLGRNGQQPSPLVRQRMASLVLFLAPSLVGTASS